MITNKMNKLIVLALMVRWGERFLCRLLSLLLPWEHSGCIKATGIGVWTPVKQRMLSNLNEFVYWIRKSRQLITKNGMFNRERWINWICIISHSPWKQPATSRKHSILRQKDRVLLSTDRNGFPFNGIHEVHWAIGLRVPFLRLLFTWQLSEHKWRRTNSTAISSNQ